MKLFGANLPSLKHDPFYQHYCNKTGDWLYLHIRPKLNRSSMIKSFKRSQAVKLKNEKFNFSFGSEENK